jgi:hypothetical protein
MADLLVPSRRGFLIGFGALLAAPAIVRASSLMPVSVLPASVVEDPLLSLDIHKLSSIRWVAVPGGEIIIDPSRMVHEVCSFEGKIFAYSRIPCPIEGWTRVELRELPPPRDLGETLQVNVYRRDLLTAPVIAVDDIPPPVAIADPGFLLFRDHEDDRWDNYYEDEAA